MLSSIRYALRHAAAQLALVHMQRIPRCRLPKPRIVHLAGTDPQKEYAPHCTELHRCGDDTGCCDRLDMTCTASRTELVVLYFYVSVRHCGGMPK